MTIRTAQRVEFLGDVLVTAIENGGYGFFDVVSYDCDHPEALIMDPEDKINYMVDIDVIARGIGVIRNAKLATFGNDEVLANASTGERLFVSENDRALIMECSRENDAGEIDVVLALAILECGLFGKVVYA